MKKKMNLVELTGEESRAVFGGIVSKLSPIRKLSYMCACGCPDTTSGESTFSKDD
jgi:hypothetical protein